MGWLIDFLYICVVTARAYSDAMPQLVHMFLRFKVKICMCFAVKVENFWLLGDSIKYEECF